MRFGLRAGCAAGSLHAWAGGLRVRGVGRVFVSLRLPSSGAVRSAYAGGGKSRFGWRLAVNRVQPVEYHIRVDNTSAAEAHHVVVMNAMPANARLLRASPEPNVKEPELQWRLGTMRPGGCYDITLVLQN